MILSIYKGKLTMGSSANQVKPARILDAPIKKILLWFIRTRARST